MAAKVPLRNKIKQEASDLMKQGTSKQETYLILVDRYQHPKLTAETIRYIPSAASLKKNGIWNTILLIATLLIAVLSQIAGMGWYLIPLYLFLGYLIVARLFEFYIVITTMVSFALLVGLALIINDTPSREEIPEGIIGAILLLILIILPIVARDKICPPPKETKTNKTDHRGKNFMRINYTFREE